MKQDTMKRYEHCPTLVATELTSFYFTFFTHVQYTQTIRLVKTLSPIEPLVKGYHCERSLTIRTIGTNGELLIQLVGKLHLDH